MSYNMKIELNAYAYFLWSSIFKIYFDTNFIHNMSCKSNPKTVAYFLHIVLLILRVLSRICGVSHRSPQLSHNSYILFTYINVYFNTLYCIPPSLFRSLSSLISLNVHFFYFFSLYSLFS